MFEQTALDCACVDYFWLFDYWQYLTMHVVYIYIQYVCVYVRHIFSAIFSQFQIYTTLLGPSLSVFSFFLSLKNPQRKSRPSINSDLPKKNCAGQSFGISTSKNCTLQQTMDFTTMSPWSGLRLSDFRFSPGGCLIIMVNKSPISRVVGPLPNGRFMAYTWGWS